MPAPTVRHVRAKVVEPLVVEDREAGGDDGTGAEEEDDGEAVLRAPQGLREPPAETGQDAHEEGQVGASEVAVEQRPCRPEADQPGLVGGDLQ